jgi:hypothetical protein
MNLDPTNSPVSGPAIPPKSHTVPANPRANNRYDKAVAQQELAKAIGNANDVLATATTVFPFTLFPDTISIDRSKVSIAHRNFFRVAEVMSIRIEDILNVTVDVGPFFGSLVISTRFFDNDNRKPYKVNYLSRPDALKIKRIIQGYVIATQQQIDCSSLSTQELATMLDQLGQGQGSTEDMR